MRLQKSRTLTSSATPISSSDRALATSEARWLTTSLQEPSAVHKRETIYSPVNNFVLLGAHVTANGRTLWPYYDCAKNASLGLELPGDDPIGKTAFNVSLGLMYDPPRQLIWAVGQNGRVHVLRLNLTQTQSLPLAAD